MEYTISFDETDKESIEKAVLQLQDIKEELDTFLIWSQESDGEEKLRMTIPGFEDVPDMLEELQEEAHKLVEGFGRMRA